MTYGSFRWRRILFAHFRIEARALADRIPAPFTLDRVAGDAHLSVVALDVAGPAPAGLLESRLATLFAYRQLNLRTYVVGPGGPGIFLLDTRVDRPVVAAAARLVGQPYRTDATFAREADGLVVRAEGVTLLGRRHGIERPSADPIERELLERYWAYGTLPGGRPYAVRIAHEPWTVAPVAIPRGAARVGGWPAAELVAAGFCEGRDVRVVEVRWGRRAAGELVPV